MIPLAQKLRPKNFDDIIGQDFLVGKTGVLRVMLEKNHLMSVILFGPPGTGKTTIANIIKQSFPLSSYSFNASTDNKSVLKDIVSRAKTYGDAVAVIDEIHRMKKDIQDYLLPEVESGALTIIGLTTSNPYISINPAIRSRCHVYQLNSISSIELKNYLNKIISKNEEFSEYNISENIIDYIVASSGQEIRTAINMLESLLLVDSDKLNLETAKQYIGVAQHRLDKNDINYYDVLSAFIKSIRGSNPDAALHYLARLIKAGDLDIICRRLVISSYEDIGFGNPQVISRVQSAVTAAKAVGFPEARIPLSFATIDLATSPKSNCAEAAIDAAISDYDSIDCGDIPKHILNREIKGKSVIYKYPHDYPNNYVNQEYMPSNLRDKKYFKPKGNGKYEQGIIKYMELLKKPRN